MMLKQSDQLTAINDPGECVPVTDFVSIQISDFLLSPSKKSNISSKLL